MEWEQELLQPLLTYTRLSTKIQQIQNYIAWLVAQLSTCIFLSIVTLDLYLQLVQYIKSVYLLAHMLSSRSPMLPQILF